MGLLLQNCHKHIGRDRDPDLSLHRVLRGAVEGFDPQMLLDPFEEKYDSPPSLVELRDRQRRQFGVVGDEDKLLHGTRIDVDDTPERFRVEHH